MTLEHGQQAEDLLDAAYGHARAGRGAEAERLYDRAAGLKPTRQLRAYWPLALTRPGEVGEEWATPALKRADLHITYDQPDRAAEFLKTVAAPEHRAQVLVGQARLALGRGAYADRKSVV